MHEGMCIVLGGAVYIELDLRETLDHPKTLALLPLLTLLNSEGSPSGPFSLKTRSKKRRLRKTQRESDRCIDSPHTLVYSSSLKLTGIHGLTSMYTYHTDICTQSKERRSPSTEDVEFSSFPYTQLLARIELLSLDI